MSDINPVVVPVSNRQSQEPGCFGGGLKTPTRTGAAVAGSEESFQAKILVVNEGAEVAKVYERIHLFGLVDLRDEVQREALMDREVACLNALSPGMNARVETVVLDDGRAEKAIVMKRHDADEFLFRRIKKGEALDTAALGKLADVIANFHFNPEACPVQTESLPDFLTRLLKTEKILLLNQLSDSPEVAQKADSWFMTMERFIADNADRFDVCGRYLGEPVLGHGDLKTLNMVFGRSGDVYVLDVAPLSLWQVNTRRMDAMFFATELKLVGREAESKEFLYRYDCEYRSRQAAAGTPYQQGDVIGQTVEKLDSISEFYRCIIFFRLTTLGVDPERAPLCVKLLDEVVDRVAKSLGS